MADSLPLFHRIAGKPVIVLGVGDTAAARRRLVERAGGIVVADMATGLDRGARLAFVAHDTRAETEGDARRLRAAGLLVNVADEPELCDFTVPAIVERSPVQLAVGTGGASAGLAKALRLRLEALLPARLGALAQGLGAARARLRQRFPDAGERRRALDAALGAGGALDPWREDAADQLATWLDDPNAGLRACVVEIRLRSPDPEDFTLREARLLGSADVLVHESGIAQALLVRARADAVRREIAADAVAPALPGLVVVLRGAR